MLMGRKIIYYFILVLLLRPCSVDAQPGGLNVATILLREEKAKFLSDIREVIIDSNIISMLTRFAGSEVDSLQHSIISNKVLADVEKEKAIRSLFNFLKSLNYHPDLFIKRF